MKKRSKPKEVVANKRLRQNVKPETAGQDLHYFPDTKTVVFNNEEEFISLSVDSSHNWRERSAADAGEGFHYFPNTEEVVYSNGDKYLRATKNRITQLKIVYFGDSTCEVLKVASAPHPVATNPVILTFGTSGVSLTYSTILNYCAVHTYYPLARLAANYGIGGQQTDDMLSRDVALDTGKAITNMISLGAHVCVSRFGVNNITTNIATTNSTAVNEAAYASLISESKELIKRILKSGVFHVFEGVGGYSNIASPTENALRQAYTVRCIADMSAYIYSLASDNIEYLNPIGVTCDTTGAYLPLVSFDGIHQSGYGGLVKGKALSNILNRRFGNSLGIAYPGFNYIDAVCNSMMLSKSTGANGDLATGVVMGSVTNCTATGGEIEEIGEITYQTMILTAGASGSATVELKISLTPATIAFTSTDTLGAECDFYIEALDGTLTTGTNLTFTLSFKQLSVGGFAKPNASLQQLAGIKSTSGKFVIPPVMVGIAHTDIQFLTFQLSCFVPISEIGVNKRIKFGFGNPRLVKNPT